MTGCRGAVVYALLLAAACSQPPKSAPPEERYPLRGEVVSLDPETQTARIRHGEIQGWMEAMTMDFPVKNKAEFEKLKPGDRIAATVFVRDLEYRLGNIQVQP
jgi:protein SCO1/2